jgi:hypothetical protein
MGVGGERHAPAALPQGKTRYPLCRRLGGPLESVWTGAENLGPHRDSIPGPSRDLVQEDAANISVNHIQPP